MLMQVLTKNIGRDESLAGMTVSQLRLALAETMGITVDSLVRAAAIIRELERRGEDLSDLRDSAIPNLRKIACGQLLPEVYRRLFGKPSILNRVAALPIPDQERIAKGEPIQLYELGTSAHYLCRAEDMEPAQAQQAFAGGKIRNQAEQVAWLRARAIPKPRPAGPAVIVDRRRKGIHVEAHAFIGVADLRAYLEQLEN